jgi:ATP-dependent Lon protease
MPDDTKGKDTPKTGELMPQGAGDLPAPAPRAKNRTVHRLLSMLSIWPFRNRAFLKSLETAQEVIEKQNKLEETIIQHAHTRDRLSDLEITLAQGRYERRRALLEEQQRYSEASNASKLQQEMMDQHNKLRRQALAIEQMEQNKRALQLKKELEELSKPPPEPQKPKKTARGRSEKQKRIERARKRYDKELERIEAMTASPETKTALRQAATIEYEEELEKIVNTPES